MHASGVVSLLTDFGLVDPFVGLMHAVVLSRFPAAKIVDLCHGVDPQDVRQAAFYLEGSYRWFSPGTVHVAVVDPGVGTDRAAIAMEADGHFFVAPDNGLLGRIAEVTDSHAHRIALEPLGLPEPSRTFHGRDVFAPVAALLAADRKQVSDLGPLVTPRKLEQSAIHQVVCVDAFGNLITDIRAGDVQRFERPVVELADRVVPLGGTYAEVPRGELVALVSSYGTLEVAVREGNAAAVLGVQKGAPARLREAV